MKYKTISVFFDENGNPFKDVAREVPCSIINGAFIGASNTTKVYFYYDKLLNEDDEPATWVAVSKLPNGKIGSKVLESYLDEDINEHYALLELDSFYTRYKGDVYLALQGYQGGVQVLEDSETGIYTIVGTPTIQTTGNIRLNILYAPQFIGSDETENVNFQQILADLSTKLGIRTQTILVNELPTIGEDNVFYVIENDSENPNKANIYIWNGKTQSYVWVGDNSLFLGDYYTTEQATTFENGIKDRVTAVENELSSVASGSPAGVYATLSDLTTADPDHDKIYVVTATGNWYYWDGTQWSSGGTYLAGTNYIDGKVPLLFQQTFDLNSINENCVYIAQPYGSSVSNYPSDYPMDGKMAVLFTEKYDLADNTHRRIQFLYDVDRMTLYRRIYTGTTWSSWKKFHFSNLYMPTDMLIDQTFDLNSISENSIYRVNASSSTTSISHLPPLASGNSRPCFLFTSVTTYSSITFYRQVFFDIKEQTYFTREKNSSSNTWSAWETYSAIATPTKYPFWIVMNDTTITLETVDLNSFTTNCIQKIQALGNVSNMPSEWEQDGKVGFLFTSVIDFSGEKQITQILWDVENMVYYERTYRQLYDVWSSWRKRDPKNSNVLIEIGQGKTYTTLRSGFSAAYNSNNAKVIVYPGEYDLETEFADVLATTLTEQKGIVLGKGMDITFMAGSYVKCLLDGSNSSAKTYFSPFYAGIGNYTIKGLNIESQNTRYCVHDELAGSGTYLHEYIDCVMYCRQTGTTSMGYLQSIGGGLGEHAYIKIEGGYYKSYTNYDANLQIPISYHNGSSSTCDSKIFVHNVYLADKGYFRFGYYGSSTIVSKVEVSGCSMYSDVLLYNEGGSAPNINFEIIKWNNEIRG